MIDPQTAATLAIGLTACVVVVTLGACYIAKQICAALAAIPKSITVNIGRK